MKRFEVIQDDLVELAYEGKFDVVVHGCNCFGVMGAGIAKTLNERFGGIPLQRDRTTARGEYNKLGTYSVAHLGYDGVHQFPAIEILCNHNRPIDWFPISEAIYRYFGNEANKKTLAIVNAYTQFEMGRDSFTGGAPADYTAIRMVLRKINRDFQGKKVGIPLIGCGLAGGKWEEVMHIVAEELTHVEATVVEFQPRPVAAV